MKTIGLFQAKQKLPELVERASEGEEIGITRRGKLAAMIVPVRQKRTVKEIFEGVDEIRKRVDRSKKFTIKELIEEGAFDAICAGCFRRPCLVSR
jgi:prevent-host-death family protein